MQWRETAHGAAPRASLGRNHSRGSPLSCPRLPECLRARPAAEGERERRCETDIAREARTRTEAAHSRRWITHLVLIKRVTLELLVPTCVELLFPGEKGFWAGHFFVDALLITGALAYDETCLGSQHALHKLPNVDVLEPRRCRQLLAGCRLPCSGRTRNENVGLSRHGGVRGGLVPKRQALACAERQRGLSSKELSSDAAEALSRKVSLSLSVSLACWACGGSCSRESGGFCSLWHHNESSARRFNGLCTRVENENYLHAVTV